MIVTTSVGQDSSQDASSDSWRFYGPDGTPLVVNGIETTLSAGLAGHGIVRCFPHQIAEAVRDGRLTLLVPQAEPPPLPIQLVTPERRLAGPKVRAFVDLALPRLREALGRLALP